MTYEIDCSASRLLEQTFVPPLRLLYKFFCFLHEICEEIVTAKFLQNIQQEKEIKYSWHAHKTSSISSLLEDLFSDMTCEDARRNREDVIKNARQFQKLATIFN